MAINTQWGRFPDGASVPEATVAKLMTCERQREELRLAKAAGAGLQELVERQGKLLDSHDNLLQAIVKVVQANSKAIDLLLPPSQKTGS